MRERSQKLVKRSKWLDDRGKVFNEIYKRKKSRMSWQFWESHVLLSKINLWIHEKKFQIKLIQKGLINTPINKRGKLL